MRALAVITTASAVLALCACSGRDTTLHGTFTDTWYGDRTSHASCASQEFGSNPSATWKVRVAGHTVPVHWTGSPFGSGTCHATWTASVPGASSWRVTLVAVCNDALTGAHGTEKIARVTVPSSAAGRPVALSDASAGGDNC